MDTKNKAGICPKCKGENLTYGNSEVVDDSMSYDFTCDDCEAYGKEWYNLTFSEIVLDDLVKN